MIFVFLILLGLWPWTSAKTLTHNMSVFIQQPRLHRASKIFTALQQCVGSYKLKGEEAIPVLVSDRWLTRSQFIFIHSKSYLWSFSLCWSCSAPPASSAHCCLQLHCLPLYLQLSQFIFIFCLFLFLTKESHGWNLSLTMIFASPGMFPNAASGLKWGTWIWCLKIEQRRRFFAEQRWIMEAVGGSWYVGLCLSFHLRSG